MDRRCIPDIIKIDEDHAAEAVSIAFGLEGTKPGGTNVNFYTRNHCVVASNGRRSAGSEITPAGILTFWESNGNFRSTITLSGEEVTKTRQDLNARGQLIGSPTPIEVPDPDQTRKRIERIHLTLQGVLQTYCGPRNGFSCN